MFSNNLALDGFITKLTTLSSDEYEIIREWRNSPHVQKNFPFNKDINKEEHKRWINKIIFSNSTQYFIINDLNNNKVGVIYCVDIDNKNKRMEFGFYMADSKYFGSGFSIDAENTILNWAFNKLKLNKVYCESLSHNKNALAIHKKFGFIQDGILRDHFYRDNEYFDLIIMSCLKDEYLFNSKEVVNTLKRFVR